MQLWVVFDKDTQEAHGHFITEVKQYTAKQDVGNTDATQL
jgi:hypothetical protein